jgi:DNA-directed RNA polymerase III subunit RPC1
LQSCPGHFGHIRLPLPVFHIGYVGHIQTMLQNICKDCGAILLQENDRRLFLRELRKPGVDSARRTVTCKKINDLCKKAKLCPKCKTENGVVKRNGALKLTHDKWAAYNRSTAAKKKLPESKRKFDDSFASAKQLNPEVKKHVPKALDDMNPLRVLNLFKKVGPEDCELLGLDPSEGRPEMFLWQYLPAPPICIRPSVAHDNARTEDDLTTKMAEILQICGLIRTAITRGTPVVTIMELWEYLQLQIGIYVNSDVPGLSQPGFGKNTRGFCQRLKGKQGRFRGNLSGKRVDFSGRTVISPDPNLGIDQVAVPQLVAKNLTYPEKVNHVNIEKLRQCVLRGADEWPGAQSVIKQAEGGYKQNLRWGNRAWIARDLKYGDVVERHLEDGDVVLFNRQPSLHKLSIMSHLVKVRPWRTFRLNECVCTPYNADFDGDEMNLHVPQTEEARAEALTLMGVKHNLATPKNGEPIIAAIQDFVTAAYLISSKDRFYCRKDFVYICMHMLEATTPLELPPPAIIKPRALWTGKQVFSILMRSNKSSKILVNFDAKCRGHRKPANLAPDMDENDCYLVVRNSEVMCGRMDKSTVGSGKKDSLFYVILRDFGPDAAVTAMNRLARLCARYLGNYGFSVGVFDVFPTMPLREKKRELIVAANAKADDLIHQFNAGKMSKDPGCNLDQTLENKISGVLNVVRSKAGDKCLETLSRKNAPLTMATSGSKGSNLNVAQMVAVVGQQIISGERVPNGFQNRSLPHFPKDSREPAAKGFVENSFYSGLYPPEFLFHAISGREGLVDTAVKTAETGYMSRRLMKSLEDLSTKYDDTVRTSGDGVVQFQFGSDKLDPVNMEGSAQPVNFDRTWTHAESITFTNREQSLLPNELMELCRNLLDPERAKLERRHLVTNELMDYWDQSLEGLDLLEGARKFIEDVTQYVQKRADKLARARNRSGISDVTSAMDMDLDAEEEARVDRVAKVSRRTLEAFVLLCLEKYRKAHVEPGHAVGAVGAQSIGEPGTQMTLKTFHFAGVAGMSITQGVPRIKEIINASKLISTPIITCPLQNPDRIEAAKIVKGRIEKTFIRDVLAHLEETWSAKAGYISLVIDQQAVEDMHLGITLWDIRQAIVDHKKWKLTESEVFARPETNSIHVEVANTWVDAPATKRAKKVKEGMMPSEEGASEILTRVQYLRNELPMLNISGYAAAARAVIQTSETGQHEVFVEGYGLRHCMNTEGVVGVKTATNSVMECLEVLGIEAARTTIAVEIQKVMGEMNIDPRHMELLADVMTYKGEVLGITRFGLQKMRNSVLQLASFEKTPDHLFAAAAGMKTDLIEGVSECIIMGKTMSVGTGGFEMVRRLGLPEVLPRKATVFEDAWRAAAPKGISVM